MGRGKRCILLLTVLCLAAFPAVAQQKTPATPQADQSRNSSASTIKGKPSFAEATRLSTAEAARKAAADAGKERGSDTAQASDTTDVLEFRPNDTHSQGSGEAAVAPSKESKRSAWKKVHGDAYGALDSRGVGKQAGGSVGASSKTGKSSIYVETDHSRENAPAPTER